MPQCGIQPQRTMASTSNVWTSSQGSPFAATVIVCALPHCQPIRPQTCANDGTVRVGDEARDGGRRGFAVEGDRLHLTTRYRARSAVGCRPRCYTRGRRRMVRARPIVVGGISSIHFAIANMHQHERSCGDDPQIA